jgi:phage terminase small subunit
MPRGLSDGARGLWRRLAVDLIDLGIMTDVDVPAFVLMADITG